MTIRVPIFPTVQVTIEPDGSARLNVAGTHIAFPAAPIADTRAEIVKHVATIATELGRPVRMNSTEQSGSWLVAVGPSGELINLDLTAPSAAQPTIVPRAQQTSAQPVAYVLAPTTPPPLAAPIVQDAAAAASPQKTAIIERLDPNFWQEPVAAPAPAPSPAPVSVPLVESIEDLEATRLAPRAGKRLARLAFSTGDSATITTRTLIGRRPHAIDEEAAQLVTVADATMTVSKTHCLVYWEAEKFWIIDRGSANGTIVALAGSAPVTVQPGQPFELQAGATVHLGDQGFTVDLRPVTA